MTTWAPEIENRAGPLYRAICDALADDIASGKVGPGMRLPTHRDLAWKLGVTVGTVTRAYAEAERRGLISGEVGRGTYVKAPSPDYPQRRPDDFVERRAEGHPEAAFIDLAGNSPPPAPATAEVARAFMTMASDNDLQELLRYRPSHGLEAHRAAGALWVADSGLKVDPSQVIPTHGAQQGLLLAVGAVLRAGDVLLCEDLTFFGIKSVARLLGLRLHGVAHDDDGVLPDALEQAIRQSGARAFYSIPTLQNPTNSILTEERRHAVAEICRRHGVTVIEDDIYRFLVPEAPPPIAHFLPEQTLYVTNLSKCVAPALRVGFVAGPAHLIKETFLAMRASSVMASPLLQEVAARLIRDGTARLSAEMTRRETMARQKLGKTILGHLPQASHPAAFHVWLRLPDQWRPEAFAAAAQRRNVGVAAADVFAASRQPSERAVRVCLTAARTHEQLRAGLEIIADLIGSDRGRDMPLI